MLLHLLSPIFYILFVKSFDFIPTCPNSKFMKSCRKIHNITLSLLSFLMLVGITYGTLSVGKFTSIYNLLCLRYGDDKVSNLSARLFLYSKYLEWFDTLFLHLSGKKISNLQYTHHMTTAFLTYLNLVEYMSPFYFIPFSLNCFVHIPMYWYFAFPKGFLRKYRKKITQIQIFQHLFIIISGIYMSFLENCEQNKYGYQAGFLLYHMYLIYFILFYLNSYFKKIK